MGVSSALRSHGRTFLGKEPIGSKLLLRFISFKGTSQTPGGGAQLKAVSLAVPTSSILLLLSDDFSSKGTVRACRDEKHPCSLWWGASLLAVLWEEASPCPRAVRPLLWDPAEQPEFNITDAAESCRSWRPICKRTFQLWVINSDNLCGANLAQPAVCTFPESMAVALEQHWCACHATSPCSAQGVQLPWSSLYTNIWGGSWWCWCTV